MGDKKRRDKNVVGITWVVSWPLQRACRGHDTDGLINYISYVVGITEAMSWASQKSCRGHYIDNVVGLVSSLLRH